MGSLRLVPRTRTSRHIAAGTVANFGIGTLAAILLLSASAAFAQSSPTYNLGRTPTAEEIRALDISIGPTGEELPPGRGNAREGAQVFRTKGCAGCHGAQGIGGAA